jgi:hypothetical protein
MDPLTGKIQECVLRDTSDLVRFLSDIKEGTKKKRITWNRIGSILDNYPCCATMSIKEFGSEYYRINVFGTNIYLMYDLTGEYLVKKGSEDYDYTRIFYYYIIEKLPPCNVHTEAINGITEKGSINFLDDRLEEMEIKRKKDEAIRKKIEEKYQSKENNNLINKTEMKEMKDFRKCEFELNSELVDGYFHKWESDKAIVEDKKGRCRMVDMDKVRFTDFFRDLTDKILGK